MNKVRVLVVNLDLCLEPRNGVPPPPNESPSFPTEPGDAHLMNARGVWNPKAKPAAPQSGY